MSVGRVAVAAGLPSFTAEDDAVMLWLARAAVEAAVRPAQAPEIAPADLPHSLREPAGAFVTLTEGGHLRGCLGRMDPDRPLWRNIVDAAAAVPVADHRFPPVAAGELDCIAIEVTVVGAPMPIADPPDFEPERDGIVVERGRRRAVLLPQVARERGWDRETTLAAVCEKAGLGPLDWTRPGTRLAVFASHEARERESGG
jgi:AmmeMemoRadiSam system protein A